MVEKASIQHLDKNLTEEGLVIPTDYVVMKENFKREMIKFYLSKLESGQTILDLNPGFCGLYGNLDLHKYDYNALEQNAEIRAYLEAQNIKVQDWKIPAIPFEDNSIDYVVSAPFIEHLPTYLDALNFLIETKRVLKADGKILIIFPNYLSLKSIFFEDYKHGWVTTKKRLQDMLLDCHYQILDTRYTIGWITMRKDPAVIMLKLLAHAILLFQRMYLVERFLEVIKLDKFSSKIKKTIFELVVIEAQIKKGEVL